MNKALVNVCSKQQLQSIFFKNKTVLFRKLPLTELPMPVRRGLEKVHLLDYASENPLNANPCATVILESAKARGNWSRF